MQRLLLPLIMLIALLDFSCTAESDVGSESGGTNVGSYATMLTIGKKLYAVTDTEIITIDITDPKNTKQLDKQELGFSIESLYHYNGLLFVGSASQMYIFSIGGDGIPRRESTTSYFQLWGSDVCSHDPIVVKDDLAYVTLSTSIISQCTFRQINELRVYDVADIRNPKLISTTPMSLPKGLGYGGSKLFVCDQTDGLVVFDLTDPMKPAREKNFSGFAAFDIIVKGDLLMVVSEKALHQFDISDENNITFLAKIDL